MKLTKFSTEHLPIYYENTVMYIGPRTLQTFEYATPKSHTNNRQLAIALNFDKDEKCVLTFKPVLRVAPTLFESKQIQPKLSPYTLTTQQAVV